MRAFVTRNFGYAVPVPRCGWSVRAAEEKSQLAKGLQDFSVFIKNMNDAGQLARVANLADVAEQFGLQLTDADHDVDVNDAVKESRARSARRRRLGR